MRLPVDWLRMCKQPAIAASATQRGYDADLRHFKGHGGAIPASAEMIAEYLAAFAGKSA